MKLTETPHVKIFQRDTVTFLPLAAYEDITRLLESGAEFWEGQTLYGATAFIRLTTVTDVHFVPQSAIDLAKREEDEAQWEPS